MGNNAALYGGIAQGLASGFQTGMGLGMEKRRLSMAEAAEKRNEEYRMEQMRRQGERDARESRAFEQQYQLTGLQLDAARRAESTAKIQEAMAHEEFQHMDDAIASGFADLAAIGVDVLPPSYIDPDGTKFEASKPAALAAMNQASARLGFKVLNINRSGNVYEFTTLKMKPGTDEMDADTRPKTTAIHEDAMAIIAGYKFRIPGGMTKKRLDEVRAKIQEQEAAGNRALKLEESKFGNRAALAAQKGELDADVAAIGGMFDAEIAKKKEAKEAKAEKWTIRDAVVDEIKGMTARLDALADTDKEASPEYVKLSADRLKKQRRLEELNVELGVTEGGQTTAPPANGTGGNLRVNTARPRLAGFRPDDIDGVIAAFMKANPALSRERALQAAIDAKAILAE